MPTSPRIDITCLLANGSDGNPVRTPRTYFEAFPMADILLDPTENYRWQSKEAMESDTKATMRDPSGDSGGLCTYRMLVDSIRTMGIEDPVGLVKREDGKHHVVFGFTRVLAAKELNFTSIPAFVYEESLPYEEAQLLQLRENSLTLKRAVNWVAEVEMYMRLVGYTRKSIEAMPASKRPKGETAKMSTPKRLACAAVAQALGVAPATMKNRYYVLQHIDPRIRELSEKGVMNYAAASEFSSGDAAVPFTKEFVTGVLDEMRRNDPEMTKATAETVRRVMRQLKDAGEKPMYEGGVRPSTVCGQWSAGQRQSPGALRDLSVALWAGLLARTKMTLGSDADRWNKLKQCKVWFTVVGIGIGSADVTEPVLESTEDTGRAELQHEETAWRYAMSALIQAALAADMKMGPEQMREWMNSQTVQGGSKALNRMEFHNAVQSALDGENHMAPTLPIVRKAREDLRERLGV